MLMETSPFLTPGFLVPVSLAVIGFITWLIRLESKVSINEKEASRANVHHEETRRDLDAHTANAEIHFNQRLATEVQRRTDDRVGRIESDVKEIKEIVKGLAAR